MDSLRYWVQPRCTSTAFASTSPPRSAATTHGFDRRPRFFDAVAQDPVLARVKLIAEPWDAGIGGYQVGAFPAGWSEWNDRFRDTVRSFWIGKRHAAANSRCACAARSDLFPHAAARRRRAINYVTAHDGFTLRDLVSYSHKHNEANGEDNRDGHADNRSWNCGVEGPTDDPAMVRGARRGSARCSPRCSCRRARRCCSAATSSAAPSAATTTPIARTTRPAGSTGRTPTRR